MSHTSSIIPSQTSPELKSRFQATHCIPTRQSTFRSLCLRTSAWLALALAPFLPFTAQAQSALVNGGNLDATLASKATDTYTVSATGGDRIVLQIAKLSGGVAFTPTMEVLSPDGTRLAVTSDPLVARLDVQAPATGTYTVAVSDASGTGSGNYRLRLAQVPGVFTIPAGDEGGALTNGASHPGTIDVGDLDLWTVSASPGDWLTLQISKLSGGAGFTPMMELFAPDGTRVGVDSDALAARVDAQATLAGTYTVLVSDAGRTGTGTYQLQLAHIPGSFVVPSGDEGGLLADGTDTDGAIALGDLDLWSFNASVGDHVTLQITKLTGGANFKPRLELFGPNGQPKAIVQDPLAGTLDIAIETAGTYTLLVSDANQTGSGTYRLHLTRGSVGPPEANTLVNGSTASGSVTAPGETNRWSFTASAGENLIVRIGETATSAFVPWLRLYSPAGVLLGQDFSAAAAEVEVRATNGGTFLVLVSDGSGGKNQTGSYRISLAKTGSPLTISASDEGGPLVNGTTYLGTIDTGDIDAWTFNAVEGQNIVVRMGETSGSTLLPWLRLYGPNGALLSSDFHAAAAEVTARATNSGTYLVVAGDGNVGLAGTGNYRLSLALTGSQPTISATDEGGPLVNGTTYLATIDTGDIDSWTFTANAGQNIIVRAGETTSGSTLLPWLRLYGPNGELISSDFSAAAAEVTARATDSGTYLVVVGDGSPGFGGIGNYRLSLALSGTQPTISATDEGGPLVNGTTYLASIDTGDIDAWTFTANAGENIVLRMGETTAGSSLLPWLRLYDPSGVLLDSAFNSAVAEVTVRATNSGIFVVVAADGTPGLAGAGNYRLSLAKTGSPLTISATDEGGPLVNGTTYLAGIDIGDIDAWTFQANAGDNILVRMGETGGGTLLPWLRLYGPNGVLLSSGFNAAAAEVASRATNSGTFLVIAADGTPSLGGTGNYRISLAKTGSPLVISSGDEGGSMSGAGVYDGTIDTGDLDAWTFTACVGDVISLNVTELVGGSSLTPWLRLYNKDGVLLKSAFGAASAEITDFVAPISGTYLLVLSDGSPAIGGSGTYRLTVNGLTDGLKLCPPVIAGPNATITGIGGTAGGPLILLTSTNLVTPLSLWSPVVTNQFDPLGVVNLTNKFNLLEASRFFTLQVP